MIDLNCFYARKRDKLQKLVSGARNRQEIVQTGDFVSLKRSQRFTRLLAKHTILEITESKSAIENEMIQSNCNRGPLSRIIINFNMISQKGPFITIALQYIVPYMLITIPLFLRLYV